MNFNLDDDEALLPAPPPAGGQAASGGDAGGGAAGPAGTADPVADWFEGGSAGAAASNDPGEPCKRSGSGGFLGKVKTRASVTAKGVMGSQHVQAGVGFVKDASKVISEQGHQGVKLVKAKTKEVAASEQVQKSLGFVKDKTKEFKELGVVKNTTKEFKELGAAVAETADLMSRRWGGASGSHVERRPVGAAWRGGMGAAGVREMLGLDLPGNWAGVDIHAIEEMAIPARGVHTIAHTVPKGARLCWVFRVKEHSLEFGVRTRAYRDAEGTVEEEVLPLTKYGCTETIQGSWVADENWTVDLLFDNRSSVLRPKTIAYAVGVEPPGAGFRAAGGSGGSAPSRSTPATSEVVAQAADEDPFGAPPPAFRGAPSPVPVESHLDAIAPAPVPTAGEPSLMDHPALPEVALAPVAAAPAPELPAPAPAPAPAALAAASAGGGQAPAESAFEDLWGSLLDEGPGA
eukprot:CAMPEP_0171175992 /NCGR_PEP_ID=MMETSP0790-20130122/11510_1 /TAXON_ID=2925 /ORGANISM="Alexandrium catenella, Strain OF101" /LENGTH=459 /DNA_ID=CAMNT_0011640877 /DNA_START=51 /DNA_END=1426 /DNA_ORIENTATION=-